MEKPAPPITPGMSYNFTDEELFEFRKKSEAGMLSPLESYFCSTTLQFVIVSRLQNVWKRQLSKAHRMRSMG